MMLVLAPTLNPPKPQKARKYDKGQKFDCKNPERRKPSCPAFEKTNQWLIDRVRNNENLFEIPIAKKLQIAEIALITRNLVGVVLGSTVAKIYDNPKRLETSNPYTDLDVLIINRHTRNNPAPEEWGIDWFVSPPNPNSMAPSNGHMNICYRIELTPGYVFYTNENIRRKNSARAKHLYNQVAANSPSSGYNEEVESFYNHIQDTQQVPPGLYVPEPQTMAAIANHCNQQGAASPHSSPTKCYDHLIPQNQTPVQPIVHSTGLPSMPHQALQVIAVNQ